MTITSKTLSQTTPNACAFTVAKYVSQNPNNYIVLLENIHSAEIYYNELSFFLKQLNQTNSTKINCLFFNDREVLPYDTVSPPSELISKRLQTLSKWQHCQNTVLVTACQTAMHRLPPKAFINGQQIILEVGQQLSFEVFCSQLADSGYERVSEVTEPIEFAVRGGLIDVFPMGCNEPIRIEFFDDEIEQIKSFDIDSQLSIKDLKKINILAINEFVLDKNGINKFKERFKDAFPEVRYDERLEKITNLELSQGIECLLPLLHEQALESLVDYSPSHTTCIITHGVKKYSKQFYRECLTIQKEKVEAVTRATLEVEQLYLTIDEVIDSYDQQLIILDKISDSNPKTVMGMLALPNNITAVGEEIDRLKVTLNLAIKKNFALIIFVSSLSRYQEVQNKLMIAGVDYQSEDLDKDWFQKSKTGIYLVHAQVKGGFIDSHSQSIYLTEGDIYGKAIPIIEKSERKKHSQNYQNHLDLAELKEGEPVVHLEHGIGFFRGLKTLTIEGWKHDSIAIEYNQGSVLYIPIEKIYYIERYVGSSLNLVADNLGNNSWKGRKEKAEKQIEDVAATLLDIYSQRELHNRNAIPIPKDYEQFVAEFPYVETVDQTKVTQEILADLKRSKPADRLICGDVGFGKTEIAMRATYIMVANKKQVVVLVPTTLLASQHFNTFKERFAGWAVSIDMISRLKTVKEIKQILENAKTENKIDILIGTHRLLQKDVILNNLGLVIIDEEHRFGVRQKEIFKKLRAEVDILSMTATPIPRTLNMAFSNMRDISIIGTSPPGRISVKTFVMEWSDNIAQGAMLREIRRGGQVYFVHNNVSTIERRRQEIRQLLPNISIAIAHGQMPEKDLEKIMESFYLDQYQVLICTTIIETGLDVANANTILIDRADKFGLAQLHQLRGRVGRSSHQAYAYLFTQDSEVIKSDANRRLKAITDSQHIGGGFKLAIEDLDIRGAGEILGDQQKGHMQKIGLNLYMDMLNRAVAGLTNKENIKTVPQQLRDCEVDFSIENLLPDNYIHDVATRLSIYQRLSVSDKEGVRNLWLEVRDRFGQIPTVAENLFEQHKIKLKCIEFGIVSIHKKKDSFKLTLLDKNQFSITKIMEQIQLDNKKWQLNGSNSILIKSTMLLNKDGNSIYASHFNNVIKLVLE